MNQEVKETFKLEEYSSSNNLEEFNPRNDIIDDINDDSDMDKEQILDALLLHKFINDESIDDEMDFEEYLKINFVNN